MFTITIKPCRYTRTNVADYIILCRSQSFVRFLFIRKFTVISWDILIDIAKTPDFIKILSFLNEGIAKYPITELFKTQDKCIIIICYYFVKTCFQSLLTKYSTTIEISPHNIVIFILIILPK